jgi:hypothetical protein
VTKPRRERYVAGVVRWDDDDWVGEPPEGRHSRDRADPDFWRRMRIPAYAFAGAAVAAIVLLIVLLA